MDGIKMESCNFLEFTVSVIHSTQWVTYDASSSKMFMHALHLNFA